MIQEVAIGYPLREDSYKFSCSRKIFSPIGSPVQSTTGILA